MSRFWVATLAVASLLCAGQQKPADAPPQAPPPAAAPAPPAAADHPAAARPVEVSPEAVVQQLFDAMAARDALAAKELFLPDAGLFSLSTSGKVVKMPLLDFLNAIGSGKAVWKERIWNASVLVHGQIAVVWGPYDFHNNGAFSHCGYDSFSLLKTTAGWKISYISDTKETEGCQNPLGPPQ
jgi:hypothetical protein